MSALAIRRPPVRALLPHFEWARKVLQASGPYLLLELLLPGGTMFALLLFLYRRKGSRLAGFVQRVARVGQSAAVQKLTDGVMLPLDVYAWAKRVQAGCHQPADGLAAFDIAAGCSNLCHKSEIIAVHW